MTTHNTHRILQTMNHLNSLISERKFTILVFYRGDWSDTCREYLRDLNRIAPAIRCMGGEIVGVCPQRKEVLERTTDVMGLRFPLFSDEGNSVASRYLLTVTYGHNSREVQAMKRLFLKKKGLNEEALSIEDFERNVMQNVSGTGITRPGVVILTGIDQVFFKWSSTVRETSVQFGNDDSIKPLALFNLCKYNFGRYYRGQSRKKRIIILDEEFQPATSFEDIECNQRRRPSADVYNGLSLELWFLRCCNAGCVGFSLKKGKRKELFHALLSNEESRTLFYSHLHDEGSSDSLQFLDSLNHVEEWTTGEHPSVLLPFMISIHNDFTRANSPQELSIPQEMKQEIEESFSNGTPTLSVFSKAEEYVLESLQRECLPRFLKTHRATPIIRIFPQFFEIVCSSVNPVTHFSSFQQCQ